MYGYEGGGGNCLVEVGLLDLSSLPYGPGIACGGGGIDQ